MPKPSEWLGVTDGLIEAKRAYHTRQLDASESILREILEFAPAEAKAWAWLGKVLERKGSKDEADDCLQRARRLLTVTHEQEASPMPASPVLAELLWQQGEQDEARQMLDGLLARQPGDARLLQLKSRWNEESGA